MKLLIIYFLIFSILILNFVNIQKVYADEELKKSIIITELLPAPDSNLEEQEWIEIFNATDNQINLTDWSFTEDLTENNCDSSPNSVFKDITLLPKEYFVVLESDLKVTLNNSEDEIFLCDSENRVVDKVKYNSSIKSQSYSRIFKDDAYIEEFQYSTIQTPGEQNKFLKDTLSAQTIKSIKNLQNEYLMIEGILSVDQNLLGSNIFYIQDSTAGIKVKLNFTNNLNFKFNNKVNLIGKYNGSEFIVEKESDLIKIENSNLQTQNPSQITKELYDSLISIQGEIIENYSTSFDILVNNQSIRVKILSSTNIIKPEKSKGDTAEITGILVFEDNQLNLYPRYQNDIKIIPKPEINKISAAKTKSPSKSSATSLNNQLGQKSLVEEARYTMPQNYINDQETHLTTDQSVDKFILILSFSPYLSSALLSGYLLNKNLSLDKRIKKELLNIYTAISRDKPQEYFSKITNL